MAAIRLGAAAARTWELREIASRRDGRRAAAAADPFLAQLDPRRLALASAFEAGRKATTRVAAADATPLRVEVEAQADEHHVLFVRHPSGAITFHAPDPVPTRRRAAVATVSFTVPTAPRKKRGAGGTLRGFVLRAVGRLLDPSIARLAARWEATAWRRHGLVEGWVRIVASAGGGLRLERAAPKAAELAAGPSLLLLHGTFSDTRGSFGQLATTGFFERAREKYADRIFGFEHHSVGKSLEQNRRELLAALPAGRHRFDLVGYSRGALLVRSLLEWDAGGDGRAAVDVGAAAFVAGPHRGTPLASPARYRETLGWVANLVELFPDAVFTAAVSWIAEALVWMAHRVLGALPGLAAMDPSGPLIAQLRRGARDDVRYAAVVADFAPDAGLRARLLDVAADGFFAGANDLVVPLAGATRLGGDGTTAGDIPAARVLRHARLRTAARAGSVHHVNLLAQPATSEFLLQHLLRGAASARRRGTAAASPPARKSVRKRPPAAPPSVPAPAFVPAAHADATFHILVLAGTDAGSEARPVQVVASYGGARVVERYAWRERDQAGAGRRWREIVVLHGILLRYFRGEAGATPLGEEQLDRLGRALFEALFVGQVGRLYDQARAQHAHGRLNVVRSSNVPRWAEKPWEFAWDPVRRSPLATQEVHLLRDVLGAIPSDRLDAHAAPLRVLVAYAQPIDASALSVEEERRLIARGFKPLVDAGLARIEVLARATPAALHAELSAPRAAWDVLHFIGHGEFDEKQQRGKLLFEDAQHRTHTLNERQLREIVARRGLRLVFLNACETARGGAADFARGVAPALLRDGVPAVIANQYSVFDSSAVSFAQELYARLARGATIAEATREARIALNYGLEGNALDWAVPALFTRVPELRLVTPDAGPDAVPTRRKPGARRRGGVIGVWDASQRLPDLGALLERLNRAQNLVGFERVDLPLPLDARAAAPGGAIGIDAQIARRRLRRQPAQLGLDLLIGLSHLPLKSRAATGASPRRARDKGGEESIVLHSYAGEGAHQHAAPGDAALIAAIAELAAAHFTASGHQADAAKLRTALLSGA